MIADAIRKLLSPKAAPTRATLEKAIRDAQIEHDRATSSVSQLQARRRDILLSASDDEAAAHDALMAKEQRAADRAAVLLDELNMKHADAVERERVAAIAAERKAAEEQVATAIAALGEYEDAARRVAVLVDIVEAGETAAKEFNSKYPDEETVVGPEVRVRMLPASPRRDLKRERFSAWVYDENSNIVPEGRLVNLHKIGAARGILTSPQSLNRSPVSLREFEKVTFVPASRAVRSPPLSASVVLPAVRPNEPPILDVERRLPVLVARVQEVEEEIVPVSSTTAAANAA